MQRRKNVRLLITLLVLLLVTVAVAFVDLSSSESIDSDIFKINNTTEISRIVIDGGNINNELVLSGRQWKLNDTNIANLNRINDLFSIFEKSNVVREVLGDEKKTCIDDPNKMNVSVFGKNEMIKQFTVTQNAKHTITYFINQDNDVFVVNIPGYNYHIAQLFTLSSKDWRTNYVFASNWTTLDKLEISYPNQEGFRVLYDPTGYYIEGVQDLDTAKMYSYLEQISFLKVGSFLEQAPEIIGPLQLSINVEDAGSNAINLSFYRKDEFEFYGYIDSLEWATFRSVDVKKLMKDTGWFEN